MDQLVRYCTSSDGVRLAYSVVGKKKPIVRASHWLTHPEYDLKGPVWRQCFRRQLGSSLPELFQVGFEPSSAEFGADHMMENSKWQVAIVLYVVAMAAVIV